MNVKRVALFVGMCCFAGTNASEEWFDIGVYVVNKNPSAGKVSLNLLIAAGLKDCPIRRKGSWRRSFKNDNRYSEINADRSCVRYCVNRLTYSVADELVAPIVLNSSTLEAAVKNFSLESQKEIKEEVILFGACALSRSAEALYDYHYDQKPLNESAKEFAINTGTHVTSKVVYHSLVRPVIKEVVAPELEPAVKFLAGYATAYVIMQMMKAAQ